jgi:hypothetical protein
MLVDGFVEQFNEHRAATFIPGESICADESISRWYGQGGDWINHGLPCYVAIDRKPENGCEIQNAACGTSGVMLQLHLVKSAGDREGEEGRPVEENHGTQVLRKLLAPWSGSDRLVCADSYFSSVATVEEMKRMGFRYIGVVKTATKKYPMAYLSNLVLQQRGDRHGVVRRNDAGMITMMAFVWMDRERRYFIASAGSLAEGRPYVRHRWRQVTSVEQDEDPEYVELVVPQPRAAELYYNTCPKIDQHNRDRQSSLSVERKLVTNDWSQRVNLSIFAMIVVDTWRVYSQFTFPTPNRDGGDDEENDNWIESQKCFYGRLAAELIDNRIGQVGGRPRCQQGEAEEDDDYNPAIDYETGEARSGVDAHITPTKRRQKDKRGREKVTHSLQGRCQVCGEKTTYECSVCRDGNERKSWICHTKRGKICFPNHITASHAA